MSNEPHVVIQGVDMVYETAARPLTALSGIDLSTARRVRLHYRAERLR